MKLSKWLKVMADAGIYVVYWTEDAEKDETPLWQGWVSETPFWIANTYKIGKYNDEWDEAVSFRHSLGKDCNDHPGLVITLVEK